MSRKERPQTMARSYSVKKRNNVYYLRHRITPDGRQVQVSLRTDEQREAHRRATKKVREAEIELACAESSQVEDPQDKWGNLKKQLFSDTNRREFVERFGDMQTEKVVKAAQLEQAQLILQQKRNTQR